MREEPKKLVEQGKILISRCDNRKWKVNYITLMDKVGWQSCWTYELELLLEPSACIPIVYIFSGTQLIENFYTDGIDNLGDVK